MMWRIALTVMTFGVLVRLAAPCHAELFSVDVPDMQGTYYGFAGVSHESAFDFGREFLVINEAWLHVAGAVAFPTGGFNGFEFSGSLDGVAGPVLERGGEEFDVDVPLTPTGTVLDGNGTLHLFITVTACCDHTALVTEATLWFDATPVPKCGDGTVDPSEECDSGIGCTDCVCDGDFEPTAPPSLDCRPTCGNGSIDPAEECDGGLGCVACLCNADFEPTAPPSVDCRPTCGNDSIDPGEQCDGLDDSACPGACLSDCTCGLFCGNGACESGEDSCNCPVDCGTPTSNEVAGAMCSDGLDNDCDGLVDSADADCAAIPTVSAWGLVVTSLLLLTGAKVHFGRRRRAPRMADDRS